MGHAVSTTENFQEVQHASNEEAERTQTTQPSISIGLEWPILRTRLNWDTTVSKIAHCRDFLNVTDVVEITSHAFNKSGQFLWFSSYFDQSCGCLCCDPCYHQAVQTPRRDQAKVAPRRNSPSQMHSTTTKVKAAIPRKVVDMCLLNNLCSHVSKNFPY
jgi:hypothetical protein